VEVDTAKTYQNTMAEMQDQKRGLNEAVSKELKAVDKKRLDTLNKVLKTGITSDKCV
jgi:hypothetical protein